MATVEAPPRLQVRLHKGPFVNEPYVDFSKEENARKMRAAIEKVRGELGREYDLVIGGKHVKTNDKIRSLESCEAVASRRTSPKGREGPCRARDERRAQGFRKLEPDIGRGACQPAVPRWRLVARA